MFTYGPWILISLILLTRRGIVFCRLYQPLVRWSCDLAWSYHGVTGAIYGSVGDFKSAVLPKNPPSLMTAYKPPYPLSSLSILLATPLKTFLFLSNFSLLINCREEPLRLGILDLEPFSDLLDFLRFSKPCEFSSASYFSPGRNVSIWKKLPLWVSHGECLA